MKLAELIGAEVKESISYRGDTLNVVWTPDKVTRSMFEEVQELQEDLVKAQEIENDTERESAIDKASDAVADSACNFLATGIASWGLEDIEPVAETFKRDDFPPMLLLTLTEKLSEVIASGKQKQSKSRRK